VEDVPELEPMDQEEGAKLLVSLYISDFISQFHRPLGLSSLTYQQLQVLFPELYNQSTVKWARESVSSCIQ
jgi:hypothetical protein